MEITILLAPVLGAVLCGFGWRLMGETAALWTALAFTALAGVLSWVIYAGFDGTPQDVQLLRFIESGTLSSDWALRVDGLSSVLMVLVTSLCALVQLGTLAYVAREDRFDPGEVYRPRLMAYLGLMGSAMLVLVMAENLLQMLAGWGLVGVGTYLLVSFIYRKPGANAAGAKALVIDRIGDGALLLASLLIYRVADSVRFEDVFAVAPDLGQATLRVLGAEWTAATLIGLLLVLAAMAKSAQVVLHVWAADASAAPAPGLALLLSAGPLAAGAFLLCRMAPVLVLSPDALWALGLIGILTAFVAGAAALVETDIKRLLAHAGCAHVGFIFVAAGAGAFDVALDHLVVVATCLALITLGAGLVIKAMGQDLDMRHAGGLRQRMPVTFWLMVLGMLGITAIGLPLGTPVGFGGFATLSMLSQSLWSGGAQGLFWLQLGALALLSFVGWRLIAVLFMGKPRGNKKRHAQITDGAVLALVPMAVMASAAAVLGMRGTSGSEALTAPTWVATAPLLATLLGTLAALAIYLRAPTMPARLAERATALRRLMQNGGYIDAAYTALITRPALAFGALLAAGPFGAASEDAAQPRALPLLPLAQRVSDRLHPAVFFVAAFTMITALTLLVTWLALRDGSA